MVAKTMEQQKICQECNKERNCRQIYQKLANFKGRSLVLWAVVAFLLPIAVFVASLAAFERTLAETISAKQVRTILSFLLALSITFIVMLIIKIINKRLGKDRHFYKL